MHLFLKYIYCYLPFDCLHKVYIYIQYTQTSEPATNLTTNSLMCKLQHGPSADRHQHPTQDIQEAKQTTFQLRVNTDIE